MKLEYYIKRIKINFFKFVLFIDEFDWFVKFGVVLIKGSNWKGICKCCVCKNKVFEYYWWSKWDICKIVFILMFIMEIFVLNKLIFYIWW